jgi:hypothetical protein
MSLCISVVTPEGIVVAGESRQTQVIAGVNRIGSDSAVKVFDLTNTVLAATAGWAFLQPQGAAMMRNISSIIEEFKPTIPAGSGVRAIATQLWTHFNTIYQQHITQVPDSAVQPGQVALNFIVAGYDPGANVGMLFSIDIPTLAAPTMPARTTNNPGPWWIGQIDVVARIVNGYDPRILTLPVLQAAQQAGTATVQLSGLSYMVHWNALTIQDGIDFTVGMIQVTTTIQKFTAGIAMQPGDVAGVGGPIDVRWYGMDRMLVGSIERSFISKHDDCSFRPPFSLAGFLCQSVWIMAFRGEL